MAAVLLNTVADELIVVHDGAAVRFDGDLDDYAQWLASGGPVRAINDGDKADQAFKHGGSPKPGQFSLTFHLTDIQIRRLNG